MAFSNKTSRWIAFIGLISYLFLLLHPVIGHWEQQFNAFTRKDSPQKVTISQIAEPGKSQTDCSICQHLGSSHPIENIARPIVLPILSEDRSVLVKTGFIFCFIPAGIAARAPPMA